MERLNKIEKEIIEWIEQDGKYKIHEIHRNSSNAPFDINVKGIERYFSDRVQGKPEMIEIDFSAWLPLLILYCSIEWTGLAYLSDYPDMVKMGDWSGIRDSRRSTIKKMFDVCIDNVVKKMKQGKPFSYKTKLRAINV